MSTPNRLARIARLTSIVLTAAASVARAESGPTTNDLDLALAKRLAATGEAEAARLGAPGGAIAVVDDGGHLVLLLRLDGSFPAAAEVSEAKARTAALFRMPTENLENAIASGRNALLGVDAMTPLKGGVPIAIGGRVVGAVGVSGAASAAQDTEIAQAIAASVGAGVGAGSRDGKVGQ
ncbi:MAG: heme-binding protein [Myxococcota bacterium]